MDKSQKCYAEPKKPGITDYILYDSISMKFKNVENYVIETRTMEGAFWLQGDMKPTFSDDRNALSFDWGGDYLVLCISENDWTVHKICALLSMQILPP